MSSNEMFDKDFLFGLYSSIGCLVGSHTASLTGEKFDPEDGETDEQAMAGFKALHGFYKYLSTFADNGKSVKTQDELLFCVMTFCRKVSNHLNDNQDKYETPKEFIMHVNGYAVMTDQSWDVAVKEILETK